MLLLRNLQMSQLSRAIKTILIIWAIAAICSILPSAQLGIIYQVYILFLKRKPFFAKFYFPFFSLYIHYEIKQTERINLLNGNLAFKIMCTKNEI